MEFIPHNMDKKDITIKHELVSCPRCEKIFECKMNNINQCFCQHLSIKKKILELLDENFDSCLCENCLQEINAQ
jgi:uncharacterized C2H2 Zn-finger protein